ncbi:MAG: PaaI family thioesterase [Candidatus Bathyarchaeia archaeon]
MATATRVCALAVHGGVVASPADSAAAWAILGAQRLHGVPVTVEMKASFLKPAKPGMLFAEAWNIHEGSKIYVSDVEAKNNRGELVTKSLVNYYLVQNE